MNPVTPSPLYHQQPSSSTRTSYRWDIAATASTLLSNNQSFNMRTASLWAAGVHIGIILFVLLTMLILNLLGIRITPFSPVAMKERDIEFVLVENPSQPPRNKNTKNRADRATRSGGTREPNKPLAEPQKAAGKPTPKPQPARAASQPKKQAVAQSRPAVTPRPTRTQTPPTPAAPTPRPSPPTPKAPTPVVPKNELASAPKLPPTPVSSAIKIPMPGNPKAVAVGPVVSSSAGTSSGGSSEGRGAPGPQAIPGGPSASGGAASGSPSSRGGSGGGSGGTGSSNQSGSPGGGGGRPGIDALPEPDFGPYIAELQRRIKRNWHPPSADRSKRVVAFFTISRSGQLLSYRIQQSSGTSAADQAAIAAIQTSAPFRNLPANYRGNSIDVQFIFDYDVYQGAKIR